MNKRLFLIPAALTLLAMALLWVALFEYLGALATFAGALTKPRAIVARMQKLPARAQASPVKAEPEPGGEAAVEPSLAPEPETDYPLYGEEIGFVRVPSAGIEAPVVQGDTDDVLRNAAGHAFGSSLPGEKGLIVVSAHRNTFFKTLGKANEGDEVVFETYYGTYRYMIRETRVFGAQEQGHLAQTDGETLVLITCYPFDYVGNAPKRYAAYCELVEGGAVEWREQ